MDIRKYETTKLLDRYKLNLLDVSNNRKNDLKNIIKELAPDIIFTPSYIDWHEEHIETTKLLLEVLIDINKNHNLYNPKISMYQVSVPLKLEQITHCIPMNKKELFSKWYIFFKTYLSQRYLPIVRFALNEYINGKMIDCFSGEVFSISEYDEWEYNFKKFLTQYKDIGFLKTYINDLELIREEVKKL